MSFKPTNCGFQILTAPLSPNEGFLRYLILPQDNDLAIDLRQTAVVIMAHLDRLASPYSPPNCNSPTSHKVIILSATNFVVFFFQIGYTNPSCALIIVINFTFLCLIPLLMLKMNANFSHLLRFYSYQPIGESQAQAQSVTMVFLFSLYLIQGNLAGGDRLGSAGLESLFQY